MATKIRGITLEIGGDTSGLQTSLRKVNEDLTSTQKQLKDVERLLKLDPGNVDLLRQKQELLGQAIKESGDYLDKLTAAQQAFIDAGGNVDSATYRALEREIIATQNSLQTAADSADSTTSATEKTGNENGKGRGGNGRGHGFLSQEFLDKLLADKVITQAEYDALKAAIPERPEKPADGTNGQTRQKGTKQKKSTTTGTT